MPKVRQADDSSQLVLDFDSKPASSGNRVTTITHHSAKVINFVTIARTVQSSSKPSPAMERLLSEAKKLRW